VELKTELSFTTLLGKHLSVKVQDGNVSVNNATIQTHDIQAFNGVIHKLDTVLDLVSSSFTYNQSSSYWVVGFLFLLLFSVKDTMQLFSK